MATFIPGVTDYIPQIQPWKPDLNFYSKALQRKQSQYDVAYNKVSNMYGSLLNAEMIRPDNLEKRDDFFKGIDQQIKKISTMDLSLVQNEDSAMDLFRPFYEDDNIIKDMSYTKKVQAQIQRGNSYKDCTDPVKCNGQYWPEGLDYINIMADEFKNASPEDALKMNAPEYIPWQNVTEMATKFATANKLSVTNISKDHGYIITEKNGVKGYVPLFEIFKAEYGNNPNVLQMFKVQGVLKRKGWINENLYKYNGDEGKALEAYIEQTLAENKKPDEKLSKKAKQADEYLSAKQNLFLEKVKTIGAIPGSDEDKQNRQAAQDHLIVKKNLAVNQNVANVYNSLPNSVGNLKSLRDKADYIKSNSLFNQGIFEAAKSYADATYTAKSDVDQYALESVRNQHAIKRDEEKQKNVDRNRVLDSLAKIDVYNATTGTKNKNKNSNTNSSTNFSGLPANNVDTSTPVQEKSILIEMDEDFMASGQKTIALQNNYSKGILENMLNGLRTGTNDQKIIYKTNLVDAIGEDNAKKINNGTLTVDNYLKTNPKNLFGNLKRIVNDEQIYGKDMFKQQLAQAEQSEKETSAYAQIRKNNSKLIQEFARSSDKVDAEDKEAFNRLFDKSGRTRTLTEYISNGGTRDDFEDMTKIYNKIGLEGTLANVPGLTFKTPRNLIGMGEGTTGKTAFGGVANFTDEDVNSKSVMATESYLKNASEKGIEKIVIGSNYSAKDYDDQDHSNAASALIKKIRLDFDNFEKTNNLNGTVEYKSVAANNADLVSLTIKPNQDYLRKLLGSDNKAGMLTETEFTDIVNGGVTVYMKKENMTQDNLFKQWGDVNYYDVMAAAGRPIVFDKENATKDYQITNNNGNFQVTGQLVEYTGIDKNNKIIKNYINASSFVDSKDLSYKSFCERMDYLTDMLAQQNKKIQDYHDDLKRTKNPEKFDSLNYKKLQEEYDQKHNMDRPN